MPNRTRRKSKRMSLRIPEAPVDLVAEQPNLVGNPFRRPTSHPAHGCLDSALASDSRFARAYGVEDPLASRPQVFRNFRDSERMKFEASLSEAFFVVRHRNSEQPH
jgi:hypothetical protein